MMTIIEKVKLTQEQKERIDILKSLETTNADMVRNHTEGWNSPNNKCLNEITLDSFIRALYIGYTIEKTPEEKVFDYYSSYYVETITPYNRGLMDGIRNTLSYLNIDIKGINK